MAENRCIECNKFKPWDELVLMRFTPDTEFTAESAEYVCQDCVYQTDVLVNAYIMFCAGELFKR